MASCVESIQSALKECGAKDLASLAALMGAGAAPKPTGIRVPEGRLTRNLRWPGPFFLFDCEDPPGCEPQKCNTLTHCAELIWKTPKITTGHKTTITAIEAARHSSVSAIPENLRGRERKYLYKVYGPDKASGWAGYGGMVNPQEVLAGKACPGEVSEGHRWTQKDLDEFHKEFPDREVKPITIRLISKKEGAAVKAGPTVAEKELKAKPKVPAKGKEEKAPESAQDATTTISGVKYRYVTKGGKTTYYTMEGKLVPDADIRAARRKALLAMAQKVQTVEELRNITEELAKLGE